MDKLAKFNLMEKVVRELDDLKNSQTAILKKVGQIEVHNIELSDKELEDTITDVFSDVSDSLDRVTALHESFAAKTEKFQQDNNLFPTEEGAG